jgi:hypothetical protein
MMGGEGQHVERAPMLIECNRLEEARSALMEALASSPDDAEILTCSGCTAAGGRAARRCRCYKCR